MAAVSALIILNPQAGGGRARNSAARLLRRARSLGWDVALRLTEHPGHEVSLAEEGRRESWPLIIAAGGDGTVHGVANGLLADGKTDVVLGHVPIGNGNDFARAIGLDSRSPEKNLAALAAGRVKTLDVGQALGEIFVNGLGVGFSAAVVSRLLEFKHLRGFPLYLAATYRTFASFQAPMLDVKSESHAEHGRLMMVEVTNGPTAGGGFRLTPGATPDDGVFDVCVIRKVGLLRFLRSLPSVVRGTHGRLDEVTLFRTRHIRLAGCAGEQLTYHLDGELREGIGEPVDVRLLPQQLKVLCAG